jgi:uncharacterized membrane protein
VERRLDSIDLLRGVAMILISLDHVRDYFTYLRFSPEDITHTWLALFITRRVTHLCAPLFFLLAGLAACLSAARGRSPEEVSAPCGPAASVVRGRGRERALCQPGDGPNVSS